MKEYEELDEIEEQIEQDNQQYNPTQADDDAYYAWLDLPESQEY